MNPNSDPYASQSRKERRALVVALFALLAVAAFGAGAAGPLARLQGRPGPVAQAGLPQPPAVLPAGTDSAPVTQATVEPATAAQAAAEAPPQMPADVLDWLKHLERVERARKEMATGQIAGLLTRLAMLSGAGGTEEVVGALLGGEDDALERTTAADVAGIAAEKRREWRGLIEEFDSYPPPVECLPIRNAYSQALGETRAMIVEVLDALAKSGEDPEAAIVALQGLRGTSAARIDVAARQTDDLVRDICDKYRHRKWFDVAGDVGGGMGPALGNLGR